MSFQTVCREIQHAIEDLKHIIERSQKLNGTRREKPVVKISFEGELSEEQQEILRLRYENKYSFDKIANELDLPHRRCSSSFWWRISWLGRWIRLPGGWISGGGLGTE